MYHYLTAVQSTKDELSKNDLPGDTKIVYIILGDSLSLHNSSSHSQLTEHTQRISSDLLNISALNIPSEVDSSLKQTQKNKTPINTDKGSVLSLETISAKKKQRKRTVSSLPDKISDFDKSDQPKRKRKSKELNLYQRCCAGTTKDRCLYAHVSSTQNLKVILGYLEQENLEFIICKRHKSHTDTVLCSNYVEESLEEIRSMLSKSHKQEGQEQGQEQEQEQDQEQEEEQEDPQAEMKEKEKNVKKKRKSVNTKKRQTDEIQNDEGKEVANTIKSQSNLETSHKEIENIINDNMFDSEGEKTWTENVTNLVNAMQKSVFVIGKDPNGQSFLPTIQGPEEQLCVMSWNHNRKCGIIFSATTQAFWYSYMNTDNVSKGHQILDSETISILSKYVNVADL